MNQRIVDHHSKHKGRHVSVGELKLWVRESGQGEPMLLLHGLAATGETWGGIVPNLSACYRLIVPDLPGCGSSDKPDTGYEVDALANQMLGLLDALDIAEANLVGHSFGGHVALALAFSHPERVRTLTLVDAGGLGQEIYLNSLEPLLKDVSEANVRAFLATAMHRGELISRSMVQSLVRDLSATAAHCALYVMARSWAGPAGQHHVFNDQLGELRPRTMIIWGEKDGVLPPRHGRQATSLIRDGKFVAIPNCGHFPHIEQPDAFLATLTRFLEERPEVEPKLKDRRKQSHEQ